MDDNTSYFKAYEGYSPSDVDNNSIRMGGNSSELGNNLFQMRETVFSEKTATSSIKLPTTEDVKTISIKMIHMLYFTMLN